MKYPLKKIVIYQKNPPKNIKEHENFKEILLVKISYFTKIPLVFAALMAYFNHLPFVR